MALRIALTLLLRLKALRRIKKTIDSTSGDAFFVWLHKFPPVVTLTFGEFQSQTFIGVSKASFFLGPEFGTRNLGALQEYSEEVE